MSITTPIDTSSMLAESIPLTVDREEQSSWSLPSVANDEADLTYGPAQQEVGTFPEKIPQTIHSPVRKEPPPIQMSDRRIQLLQQWECIVHSVGDGLVTCEMHDLTDESQDMEIAEVYLDEFNEFDKPLLDEGAVFYWSVGREANSVGQVRRYSELRVRRMPRLSKSRKVAIARKAKQLSELFDEQRQ